MKQFIKILIFSIFGLAQFLFVALGSSVVLSYFYTQEPLPVIHSVGYVIGFISLVWPMWFVLKNTKASIEGG